MTSLPFSNPDSIAAFQENSLKQLLHYLYSHSPFYSNLFREHNIDITKIKKVKDLVAIPVVTKDDLQQRNMDFLCVDRKNIIEYCTTSGTMGTPVTVGLTEKDLQRLAKNELESFVCAGMSSNDIVLLMLSLDRQFMAGIAYYLGARELGAGIIRGGPGNFAMQLEVMTRLKPTVLIAVPSFIVGLIAYSRENNINLNESSVNKIICIGENIRNEDLSLNSLGERIREFWNVELYSTYASTEQQTAFTECSKGKGGHHHPELMIFEILDEKGNQLPAGEYGELVITTLGVEGMPLLRYNTGDICAYYDDPCECGRTTARLSPVAGRKQQMIKYKGTTIYPQSIFNILNSMEDIQDYVISLLRNEWGHDDLKIQIALRSGATLTDAKIRQRLQSSLRIVPEINYSGITEIHKMQFTEGKRKISKLIDLR
jgi:phenylacetate-CoA ligase